VAELGAWLFDRGHAADLILAIMLAEFVWLTTRANWQKRVAFCRLVPGALMIVALRCALTGTDWRWIGMALAASFPAHLADLAIPSRRQAAPSRMGGKGAEL
jgi:hypothetical protein